MKLLKDILYKAGIEDVMGSTNVAIDNVQFDSRKVDKFNLFVAVCGTQVDGHQFIDQAIESGAVAIVCEEFPGNINEQITYVKVKNSSEALGCIATNYYDNPSEKLALIGITGTNGKTTVATLLFRLFKALGYKAGLISTVVNKIDNVDVEVTHTTPDPLQLNRLLQQMVEKKCSHCFMEVSSHAVAQNRISGLDFAGGVFTNITHDHLDYHKTFDEYIKAKKSFFDEMNSNAFALVNKDDPHWKVMLQNSKASPKTLALKTDADFKCKIIESQFSGLLLNIGGNEVWAKLIGSFNAYNVLTVYAVASLLGEDPMSILTAISNLSPVEGRFQHIKTENNPAKSGAGVTGIVDYAHTPDALKNVLKTINEIRTGNEKVITLVGCGGDRDTAKRPLMAQIACEFSDKVILTSDNPRSEDPETIIQEMQKGVPPADFKKTISITNRKEAIKVACSLAEESDIILVAGKGHEKYQEIQGVKHPFDDMEILNEMLGLVNS
ncbi:UDP-N-acetylmuramoyl-L-alanyl-D-glutamate--2,6-diaminopimelate ligase [Bacteroidales bacterium AH-315-I05]|nr:UDP-N-acetylmuramoyl-L-alanyl-D-glutamate--2,6-diaminopimelate ligase [Bacteroidales bacterium AH-315-I05]